MEYADLSDFVKRESNSLLEILTTEQLKHFKTWAQEVPSDEQQGHLIPLQKIPKKQLKIYLESLISNFPEGDNNVQIT